ncbi:MAG: hypothetical protein CMH91_03950 [Oceanicaulis sp.]|uniref:hypothetical protein n=1 Tax=unclassified Oceanicaulis TaxID=2632123 RepID=UPI000066A1F6|nr:MULTISPECIES: hypothetical protein [unclassified Oceanicaulis]EAP89823.1 hypothetical protein OA2633_06414 [Oceanicaulis sp. HTCC2633]MAB70237.1 hypothetical protein [Oceanicaulis sp.]MBC38205.1 hypothetical protein [Oceanicaulis sp.]HBU62166.1 hypothetical protein [Oceanicaulis sp.]HCR93539.1 hypothetical protein [Oceanicaulis sp.]
MRKLTLLSVLISAAALAGCKTDPTYVHPVDPYYPPSTAPVEATADALAIDTALQVCEVDSLRAQRDERIEAARALLITGYASGGDVNERYEETEGTLRVDQPPSGPQTERTEMLRAFELDLDAAYRFAEGSCRAYAACMHQRDYQEGACIGTLHSWERAQDRFTDVSLSLAEIRAEIATPSRHHRGYGHGYDRDRYDRRYHRSRRDRDCEGVIADLFTTDACDRRH